MKVTGIILAWIACMLMAPAQACFAQGTLVRKPAQELLEALGKFVAGRGERELAKELAEVGGETAVREVAERALREGGEETVEALARLTRGYGADVLRAAENSVKIPSVLKAVDELPKDAVAPALRRLAAGAEGKSLAVLTSEYGSKALLAEVRHPGIGRQFLRHLGSDGAELAMKLDTKQAITLARHTEDIAKLAPAQRDGVLHLLHNDAERMVAFMGRWMEKNPGKTLFTAAATTVLLTHSDAILGGGTIMPDDPANPHFMPNPGLLERMFQFIFAPLLRVLLPLIAVGAALWIAIKLWVVWRIGRAKIAVAETCVAQEGKDIRSGSRNGDAASIDTHPNN
jgi:hypothetical protein